MNVHEVASRAKAASFKAAALTDDLKNSALLRVAELLEAHRAEVLSANGADLAQAREDQIGDVLLKRLALDEQKIAGIIESLHHVAELPNPVGRTKLRRELDQGLVLEQITTPIGVIGVIFESRPDALVQISSLCLKTGNAVVLKGGSEARSTNEALHRLIERGLADTHPDFAGCVQLLGSREEVRALLALDDQIDLIIPRGSNALVKQIKQNTRIPVLGHADGICHLYVDREADLKMARALTFDAKCQYPAVCNAVETLLVHRDIALDFLGGLAPVLFDVELRGDRRVAELIDVRPATEEDWRTEYNDLVLSIKVVDSLAEAIEHINTFGSHHTDSIVTADESTARAFMAGVDSSSVMWNCSTRFADGFRYGLGAEVGISTNKIHARGPVGLEGLTSYQYRVIGHGHVVADYATSKRHLTHRDLKPAG